MNTVRQLQRELTAQRNKKRKALLQRFFKTGKGEYAEGDKYLGLTVPMTRKTVKAYTHLSLNDLSILLLSPWHEMRLAGLILLVQKAKREKRYDAYREYAFFYLKHAKHINNWDLVDVSVEHLLGRLIEAEGMKFIESIIHSKSLWQRRMAMVGSMYLIRKGEADLPLEIAKRLVYEKEDLMHKAVGWMLREVGKRASMKKLNAFLDEYAATMPRTTLRYAIEKHPPQIRMRYMKMKVL